MQQENSVIYGYRPVNNYEIVNSPIKTISMQRPSTPQPQKTIQRQASAPLFLTAQSQTQYIQAQPQPQYFQAPVRNIAYYAAPNTLAQPVYQRPV